jgi:uncharacterized protein
MFYTPVRLSKNQAKTPEGFLICFDCTIGRTGYQDYDKSELDILPDAEGKIRAYRDPLQVFDPLTLASGEGKDIVIDHPDDDVTPHNWRDRTHGHMQNVHRGVGVEDDHMKADLVFKSPQAIAQIEANPNQELSLGYDARYEIVRPGLANQCEIRINHIAMVDEGRCGPVCATKDHLPTSLKQSDTILPEVIARTIKTGDGMANWMQKARDMFKARDEAGFEAAMKDAETESKSVLVETGDPEDNETHTHIYMHLREPDITKPEGDLPSTGETTVTNAADSKTVGGEHAATFGGKTFFGDKALDEAFKSEMGEMKDSIKKMADSIAELGKKFGDKFPEKVETGDAAGDPEVQSAGEKADREIEGELEEEAPPGTGDTKKHKDSAFLGETFKSTVAQAAILVPNLAVPTFDSAAPKEQGVRSICGLRRKALQAYSATTDGAATIDQIAGPKAKTLDSMACRDIAPLFRAAAAIQAARNDAANMQTSTNDAKFFGVKTSDDMQAGDIVIQTMEDVQRANEQFNAQAVRQA